MRSWWITFIILFSCAAEAATSPTLKSVVTEGADQFSFQLNGDLLTVSRSDGKTLQMRVALSRGKSKVHFSLDDGLLDVQEAGRTVDLRMFDAEISFNGNTDQVVMFSPAQEEYFENLVATERMQLQSGQSVEIPHHPEFVSRILGSLSIRKNPQLAGEMNGGIGQDLRAAAKLIAEGKVPSIPRTARLRMFPLDTIWGAASDIPAAQELFRNLINVSMAEKSVLIIDEFYRTRLMGASIVGDFYGGEIEGNDNFFENMRKDLDSGRLRVISVSAPGAWADTFKSDKTIQKRFDQWNVPEMTQEEWLKRIHYELNLQHLPIPSDQLLMHATYRTQQLLVRGPGLEATLDLIKQAYVVANGGELTPAVIDQATAEIYHLHPAMIQASNLIRTAGALKEKLNKAILGQEGLLNELEKMWTKIATGVGGSDRPSGLFVHGVGGNNGAVPAITLSARLMGFQPVVIDMAQFPSSEVGYFHEAIYQRLSQFPFTVFVLKNIERAHPYVQYAALPMIYGKPVLINLIDDRGLPLIEELHTERALFIVTSSVEPGPALGFQYSAAASVDASLPAEERLRAQLSARGVAQKVLNAFPNIVRVSAPNEENYRSILQREVQRILVREGKKHEVQFSILRQDDYIEMLARTFIEGKTSFADAPKVVAESLEALIANTIVRNPEAKETMVIMSPNGCNDVIEGKNPWLSDSHL